MGKVIDRNDFWFIEKNPITKVGVFPYLGKQISADCEPDKIYYVLRPKEELSKKETLDSLKLLPLVDEHTMLGKDFTPAEEKGIDGILGEKVIYDNGTIYTDIKIFSEDMKEKIREGKKELSLGYFCSYDKQEGIYNGQRYDYVQKNIIGNHLALVDKGRMGSDVRVYDKAIEIGKSFAMDSVAIDDDKKTEWITVKGNHIPIKEGESKEQAVKKFIEGKKGGESNKSDKGSNKKNDYEKLKQHLIKGGYSSNYLDNFSKGDIDKAFELARQREDKDNPSMSEVSGFLFEATKNKKDEKKKKAEARKKEYLRQMKSIQGINPISYPEEKRRIEREFNKTFSNRINYSPDDFGKKSAKRDIANEESMFSYYKENYEDDIKFIDRDEKALENKDMTIREGERERLKIKSRRREAKEKYEKGMKETTELVSKLKQEYEDFFGEKYSEDMDIEKEEYKKNNRESKMTELEKFLTGKISQDEMEEVKKIVEKEKEEEDEDEEEEEKKEVKDKKSAKDKCSKDEEEEKEEEKEEEEKSEDEDEEEKKDDKKGMDEADVIKMFARKEKLAKEVEEVLGTFDHSEMTEKEIAKYACDKLELGAEEGQEVSTLKGYLKGVKKQKVEVSIKAEDSDFNVVEDKSFENYLKNAKK